MDRAKAIQIANDFLDLMNPNRWDGHVEYSFCTWCYEYTINEEKGTWLCIYFDCDNEYDKEWHTYVGAMDGNCQYGNESKCMSVNSAETIADAIMEVYLDNKDWLKGE